MLCSPVFGCAFMGSGCAAGGDGFSFPQSSFHKCFRSNHHIVSERLTMNADPMKMPAKSVGPTVTASSSSSLKVTDVANGSHAGAVLITC